MKEGADGGGCYTTWDWGRAAYAGCSNGYMHGGEGAGGGGGGGGGGRVCI